MPFMLLNQSLRTEPALEAALHIILPASSVWTALGAEAHRKRMGSAREIAAKGTAGFDKPAVGKRKTVASKPGSASPQPPIGRLAGLFPEGTPVRIPVQFARCDLGCSDWTSTLIEYGTSQEVIFRSPAPLEFGERVRFLNADGSLDTEAEVLAVQIGARETLVVARFTAEVANWIIKA
jgi:hypothetical protein